MKTIRLISISMVLMLLSGANLWATDYLFGYGSSTRVYLGIPASPGTDGNCITLEPKAADIGSQQRCTWHCVSSKGGTTGTDIATSSSGSQSYLYVEYNNTKYWLTRNGSTIKYTTTSNNASEFNYQSSHLCYGNNNAQISGNSLTKGSFAYVCVSEEGKGGVYVTSKPSWNWDDTKLGNSDLAHLSNGAEQPQYTIYAKAYSGYLFKGWSKTNSFTDCDPLINPPTSANHGPTTVTLPNSTGYIAKYYAMFVPYWRFSASGDATSAGHGTVSVNLTSSEVIATDNSTTTGSTNVTFTATPQSGYGFAGWTDSPSGTTANKGTENPITVTITNTTPGSTENVTLYAIFNTTYVVHFNPNKDTPHSVTGTMPDKTFVCGFNGTLPANTFVNTISTTFDGNGGQLKNPTTGNFENSYTLTQSATFHHWTDKGSPETTYWDKGTINRSGLTELNLYASWNNPGVTYPVGKRGDRTLVDFDNGKMPGQTSWPSYSYTIKARWSDPFYAKVSLSKTTGTSGTPSADVTEQNSDYKNHDLVFTITAPAASEGYHFSGWTGTNVTFDDAGKQTGAKATVKSSATAGSANANVGNITANYAVNTYAIQITAGSTSTSENIIFNVTGPDSYNCRVSVPVGGSATVSNLLAGNYTVTPEPSWSWDYTVDDHKDVSFSSSEAPVTKPASFTVSSKGSTKKRSEATSTVNP